MQLGMALRLSFLTILVLVDISLLCSRVFVALTSDLCDLYPLTQKLERLCAPSHPASIFNSLQFLKITTMSDNPWERLYHTHTASYSNTLKPAKKQDHLDITLTASYNNHEVFQATKSDAVRQNETVRMAAKHVPTPHGIFAKTGPIS
jgi:hypothetical protein